MLPKIIAMPKKHKPFFYEIKNQADNSSEILIYGYIGQWEAVDYKKFQNDFRAMLLRSKKITVRIHSGGGSVYEGLAIYDLMRSSDSEIKVVVEGMAASMASVIALGGDVIEMTENAFFMMHAPSGGYWGNKEGFKSYIQQLEQCENRLLSIYKERTKADESAISAWFEPNKDTWLDAEKCLELKICDTIVKPIKKRKFETTDMANKTMEEIFAAYDGEVPVNSIINKSQEQMKTKIIALFALAGIAHTLTASSEDDAFSKELEKVFGKAKKADELEAEITAIKKEKAETLVSAALKAGKLKPSEKDEWIQNAIDYPDLTEKALERMSGTPDVNAGLHKNAPQVEGTHELLKNRADWSFDKWQSEDPTGLSILHDEAPEEFEKLFNSKYNK